MKKHILLLVLIFACSRVAFPQEKQNNFMIKFTYHYTNKNDSDDIKLIVRNLSRVNTYYYSIAVEGLTDTGWIGLNADINSLGQNDFWVLKPIEPEVL